MNDRDIRRTQRATRVQTFLTDNAGDFAPGSKSAELGGKLDTLLTRIGSARVGQLRTPASKATLLEALFLDFKDIARTARSIELDEPAFPAASYRFPNTYTEVVAITHADSLLDLLEDRVTNTAYQRAAKTLLRGKFLAYEMPSDFMEDLRADRDAIDSATTAKTSDNLEGIESTAAIGTLLGEAQDIVTRLDALMHNKYARNPDKLTAWKAAARTERAPRRKDAGSDPAPVQ